MSSINQDQDTETRNGATRTGETSEVLFEGPYHALLPRFMALGVEELVPIDLDIPAAVTTALGVAPEVAAFKEQVARELPLLDFEPVLQLDAYAMALMHAHTLFLMASQPVDALKPATEEGTALREVLLADATALVQRRLLNGNQLRDLQGPVGYKNLAVDLQILAALFREHLGGLQGKCATSPAEIHRAEQIAAEILRTVGLREQGPSSVTATADIRARAYTLFVRVYDQARRVLSFIRWKEDDVPTIAPSLFAGRSNGRRKNGTDHPPEKAPEATPAAGPAAPAPPASGTPKAAGTPSAEPWIA